MTDLRLYYIQKTKRAQLRIGFWSVMVFVVYSTIAWSINSASPLLFCLFTWMILILFHMRFNRAYYRRLKIVSKKFPNEWHKFLMERVPFYKKLPLDDQIMFDQRVMFFLEEKKIEGIDTDIDDHIRLLVAASAIIPTFAFPFFEYPNVHEVLIYPNAFDENFRTDQDKDTGRDIVGMVGNNYMNNTVVLSKPDLLAGFSGKPSKYNVGIHEFVHLLDKADGIVDGLPEVFTDNAYTLPWLQIIKKEMERIENGRSDINPYGLTNNAEFLAVVSEYFFDNPRKFHEKHPELYEYLVTIFHQNPDR